MKINPKSWHYKVYAFTFAHSPSTLDIAPKEPPRTFTLCAYVRRIIFMTPPAVMKVAAVTTMAIVFVAAAIAVAVAILFGIPWVLFGIAKGATQGHSSALIALACFAGTIGVFVLANRYRGRAKVRKEGKDLPLDSIEIGWEAIHAGWRKVCPVLEVEDEK